MAALVCAVDVGTGSARAGIFDRSGKLLGRADRPIALNRPGAAQAEHDSEDIWAAVCGAVRTAVQAADADPEAVKGIAFDATCSLVVRDRAGGQVGVSSGGEDRWDTIAWLDHRALNEADECSATKHRVLDFSGGAMHPEMQVPKLMWLKRRLPRSWGRAGRFFDLADFLSWKACGAEARSQCTLACKWIYLAHGDGWQRDFLAQVGLPDMLERGSLPDKATPVGADLGPLTAQAAQALGLTTSCRVACGLIDAYAGMLGLLGGLPEAELETQGALIAGTSSCIITMRREPQKFPGAWGPYWGAALPGFWLSEGGQSATGALLDHVIALAGGGLKPDAATHRRIAARIAELRAAEPDLAPRLHVLPDFHGNRSPLADPHALGVISGLTLDASFDGLCRLTWRMSVALALGLRQILEVMQAGGSTLDTLHLTGGHTRSPLLAQLYADATGCRVLEPVQDEAVLLGTATVAATGAKLHPDLASACTAMRQPVRERLPDPGMRVFLERDYRVFLEMQRQRTALDALG